jgi:23S rRNA (pseudouridine1915-N3)-methyltransferase
MEIRIIFAGKPSLTYAKIGVEEYIKRLGRHGKYKLIIVKAGESKAVSERLLQASDGCYRIALDERGETPSTRAFRLKLEQIEMKGAGQTVAFLIGASDGHTQELRDKAEMVLSLSSMTMQHELALVVLLEQLYRVACMRSGSPYHRD